MKNLFCAAFVLFSFVGGLRAEETAPTTPRVIELKGHSALWLSNTGDDNSNDVAAAFSSDSQRLVTVCGNGKILLWDAESGKELKKMQEESMDVHGMFYAALSVCFTSDGKKIVVCGQNGSQIWDTETGKELHRLTEGICSLSTDGKKLVMNVKNGDLRILDVDLGNELKRFERRYESILLFDGKKIYTNNSYSGSQTIHVLDAESGKELYKIEGIRFSSISSDGTKIITYGTTGKEWSTAWSAIWDAEVGKELLRIEGLGGCLSPDGKRIITYFFVPKPNSANFARESIVWDVESGKEQYRLPGGVVFTPDGKKIVAGASVLDRLNTHVRIVDVESGKELQRFNTSKEMYPRTVSPDGKKIVLGGEYGYVALLVLE